MKNKELTNRQKQTLESKNNIYIAAINLIASKGFSNVKISDICKKAGVSTGLFYNYFASKEDVIKELNRNNNEYFLDIYKSLKSKNGIEKIKEFIGSHSKRIDEMGAEIVKQMYLIQLDMLSTSNNGDEKDIIKNVLYEIVEEAKLSGDLSSKRLSQDITNDIIVIIRGQIYEWCLSNGSYSLNKSLNDMIERCLNSIFKD